jgi:hypothetical protein
MTNILVKLNAKSQQRDGEKLFSRNRVVQYRTAECLLLDYFALRNQVKCL